MLNSCVKKLDALSILEKSFIAHGGKKSWSEVSIVAYFKNIKLYDSIGNLEEEITQKIKHTWNPSSTKIEWDKFGDYYVAQLEKEKVTLYKNHQEVLETKQLAEAYVNTKGALYVFWQPSKLLDSQAQLEDIG